MLSKEPLLVCEGESKCKINAGGCALVRGEESQWLTHPLYLAIATDICKDPAAAQDIVSDAYLSLRGKPVRTGTQFCSLLRLAVAREAVDFVRKRERRRKKEERLQNKQVSQKPLALSKEFRQLLVQLKQACAEQYGKGRGDLYVAYNLAESHGEKQVVAKEFGLTLTAASHRVRRVKRKGIDRFAADWLLSRGYAAEDINRLLLQSKENGDA